VGWGWPGLRFGKTPTGDWYISLSIPGTGFYWIKYFRKMKGRTPEIEGQASPPSQGEDDIEWHNEN
jgi:hypothetical protein